MGFFPAFPKGSLGIWSKASQMAECRQMPHTDGAPFPWDEQTNCLNLISSSPHLHGLRLKTRPHCHILGPCLITRVTSHPGLPRIERLPRTQDFQCKSWGCWLPSSFLLTQRCHQEPLVSVVPLQTYVPTLKGKFILPARLDLSLMTAEF